MTRCQITFARSARKELEALESHMVSRVWARIERLGETPRPPGCRKLTGANDLWRIRVGDYLVYAIHHREMVVDITVVRHRCNAYR
jgi:mRNA interferase RelE/StbE